MPRDPEKAKARARRYRERRHAEKYGPDAGDMRGRAQNRARGPDHPRWNDDRMVDEEGYTKTRVGKEHPLADPNGYAYEHLLVWVSAGNPRPPKGFILHHKDEIRSNNQIGNLELMTRAEHNRHHMADMARDPLNGRIMGKIHDARPQAHST